MTGVALSMEIIIEDISEDGLICTTDGDKQFPAMVELMGRFWELLHVDPSDGRAYYMRG